MFLRRLLIGEYGLLCFMCLCNLHLWVRFWECCFFGDSLWVSLLGFVDAFGFCGTVRVMGCWWMFDQNRVWVVVINLWVLVGVKELQCYGFRACSDTRKVGITNSIFVESVMSTMRYSSLVAFSGFVFGCNRQYMSWCVDYWGVRTECWWLVIGVWYESFGFAILGFSMCLTDSLSWIITGFFFECTRGVTVLGTTNNYWCASLIMVWGVKLHYHGLKTFCSQSCPPTCQKL